MRQRRIGATRCGLCGALLVLAACSADGDGQVAPTAAETTPVATDAPATSPATTEAVRKPTTTRPAPTTTDVTTSTEVTTTTAAPTTTEAPTTTVEATTTTVAAPAAPVSCVVQVQPGDSLNLIVSAVADASVSVESLQVENAIADPNVISIGQVLDVCVGNGIDDVTGQPRTPPTTAPPAPPPPDAPVGAIAGGVAAQQQKLNELFAGHGLPALTVDGVSGRLTRQQLCAARLALGLPASRTDMEPGGAEEQALLTATGLSIPAGAPSSSRWALIDQTCQIMFVGAGSDQVVFVFQTSTGQSGYPTRVQSDSRVFRYDPARANNGWHDSIDYPASGDNPLNGNMYKPLYFDRGQAIHGANSVPTDPASHGCARLRVDSQNALVAWLGLGGVNGQIWNDTGRIDFTVTVQGRY